MADTPAAIVDGIRGYRMIAAMWIRSAVAYRTSFVLLASAQFVITGLDFVMILDRPLPLGMPSFMAWTSPLAAAALLTVAGLLWRIALRSYRSTGS